MNRKLDKLKASGGSTLRWPIRLGDRDGVLDISGLNLGRLGACEEVGHQHLVVVAKVPFIKSTSFVLGQRYFTSSFLETFGSNSIKFSCLLLHIFFIH